MFASYLGESLLNHYFILRARRKLNASSILRTFQNMHKSSKMNGMFIARYSAGIIWKFGWKPSKAWDGAASQSRALQPWRRAYPWQGETAHMLLVCLVRVYALAWVWLPCSVWRSGWCQWQDRSRVAHGSPRSSCGQRGQNCNKKLYMEAYCCVCGSSS